MSLIATLDSLEEYLYDYQQLQNSFNKAFLLLTRFKLNYGPDSYELLSILENDFDNDSEIGSDSENEFDSKTFTVRRRITAETQLDHVPLTKQDHIRALKDTFRTLLTTKIVPLAELKQKLLHSDIL